MNAPPHELRAVAERAAALIPDGAVVGLGTGRAAAAFVQILGERVQAGLRIRGVPTSEGSADLARRLRIPLVTLDDVDAIDVDVDGADEVDPRCDLIKGLGGALVREKIVAAAAHRVVILVGPEKLVPVLGTHGVLPVEVVSFGLAVCRRRLADLGCVPELRMRDGTPFVSDNGNYILDCRIAPLPRPAELDNAVRLVPGVVGTGLFLGMATTVLIQREGDVEVRQRGGP